MPEKMTNLTVDQKRELLDRYLGKRISLTCQVGVCIWGAMCTLEPGRGLCLYDCVHRGDLRIGISPHIVHALQEQMDGTLSITIC